MLAPDQRSILSEALRPPFGTRLDVAVGTSFTLDLDSAVVVPLSFASSELASGTDPIAVLEAIRSVTDRVSIFAQVGHLRVPGTRSDLMSFLEPMVHEVAAPTTGYLFHPKVWVLKYVTVDGADSGGSDGGAPASYRLVCSTRNLTRDNSWDAVVQLDGEVISRRPQAENRPLAEFVRRLPGLAIQPLRPERARAIDALADELRTVTWELPQGASAVAFHALGIGEPGARSRFDEAITGHRHLVVSPFLDDHTVSTINARSEQFHLVARPDALDRLDPVALDGVTTWVLDPLAGLTEAETDTVESDSDEGRHGLLGGLHAKIHVVERGKSTRMVVGSPNATTAGCTDLNVEFAIEFTGRRDTFGIDQMLGDKAGFNSIAITYQPTPRTDADPVEDAGRQLDRLLRRLASLRFEAIIDPTPDGWSQQVTAAAAIGDLDGTRFTIGLLTSPGTVAEQSGQQVDARFRLGDVADITPFLTLSMSQRVAGTTVERSTVTRAVLIGDPPGRLDSVLARQVDSPEKFLRFVMLLLALRDGPGSDAGPGAGGTGAWAALAAGRAGLFETLARAVADRPQVIDDIDRLVERLRTTEAGRSVLPEGFEQLWDVVTAAQRLIPTAGRPRAGKS